MFEDGDNETDFCNTNSDDANVNSSYQTLQFELREHGFYEDGYDYSKLFQTIARIGEVHININTGL